MFSDGFKDVVQGIGDSVLMEQMSLIEKMQSKHEVRFYGRLESQAIKPMRLLGHNGIALLLKLLTRSLYLLRGFFIAINDYNPSVCFLCVRAHWETTGALAYLHKWLTKFYHCKCTYDELDDKLRRLFLGGRVFPDPDRVDWPDIPSSVNVMSLIDDIDSEGRKISGQGGKQFRDEYEFLSEFCHPNYLGNSIGSDMPILGKIDYFYPPKISEAEISTLLRDMAISLTFLITFYDNCFSLLNENEEVPLLFR